MDIEGGQDDEDTKAHGEEVKDGKYSGGGQTRHPDNHERGKRESQGDPLSSRGCAGDEEAEVKLGKKRAKKRGAGKRTLRARAGRQWGVLD